MDITDRLQKLPVKGISADSRSVRPGWLFAALPGARHDGAAFIEEAVRKGAIAVLLPKGAQRPEGLENVTFIEDENPRRALALLAAEFYGAQPGFIAAVTGTNGKTSTACFTQQLWASRNIKAVSMGTLGVLGAGLNRYGAMTTPDPVTLHKHLAELAKAGVTHMALEASSHGLDQYRLDGVRIRAAGFTNLTRDHLDYHDDMDSYFHAKQRLFTDLLEPSGTAVLNADNESFAPLAAICKARGVKVVTYGERGNDLRLIARKPLPSGQALKLELFGQSYDVDLPLVGKFQVKNALCALGLALSAGDASELDDYVQALAYLRGAPGRLELVEGHPKGAAVYIDYAHTPDALENVLKALRPHTTGRLICLFGCGGDRDAGKRPLMGQIAAQLADLTIVTDDNPRSEDPASIRSAILAAVPGGREIGGRAEAIRFAIDEAGRGDVLVIAGKGHEQGQIIGDAVLPFDDAQQARMAMGQTINEKQYKREAE